MYFHALPKNIQTAIIGLTTDDVFQNRFATDPILDSIEGLKENLPDEYKGLLSVLNHRLRLNNKDLPCITPAVWSFLWVSESPFITGARIPEEIDIDYFLYILYHGVGDGDTINLLRNSVKFTQDVLKWDLKEAIGLIRASILYAFRPLKLFPQSTGGSNRISFDADWLTSVVAKVHAVTGYSPEYIIHTMSLSACCYYFAQYRRQQGDDTIYKRTDEEILILQMERSVELICERLIELNVIHPDEREKYKKIMCTPPDKKKS
jgi:hypothetical protein